MQGHTGRLVIGQLEGKKRCWCSKAAPISMKATPPAQVTVPVRVMRALGIHTVILTNAAGGINRAYSAGDLMLIKDHLNFVGIAGENPLRGLNDDAVGPRFPDVTHAYTPALRELAKKNGRLPQHRAT
ncbi:MAG: hypothetical protein M5U34_07380 [Chloroflexi bacterium]|nr:hypothetical protein [Chloroflexota bacterium]